MELVDENEGYYDEEDEDTSSGKVVNFLDEDDLMPFSMKSVT